ncbi:MAG: hypothetical protein ACE5R4_18880 [Armatimonadota bacterium]
MTENGAWWSAEQMTEEELGLVDQFIYGSVRKLLDSAVSRLGPGGKPPTLRAGEVSLLIAFQLNETRKLLARLVEK